MRISSSVGLFVALLAVASPAAAQEGPATRYVHGRYDDVMELLDHPASASRDERVSAILGDMLDFDGLARGALGAHWDEHTPAEQAEFVSILRQLIERQYRNQLDHLRDFEVTYGTETTTGTGATVHTTARSRASRREPPVAIDYVVHLDAGHWRATDVVTDGVSMLHNYQQQFHRIISRDGWAHLMDVMRTRLAEGSATSTTPASTTSTGSSTTPPHH